MRNSISPIATNPPPISGMSSTGGFEVYVQNRGNGGSKDLAAATQKLIEAAQGDVGESQPVEKRFDFGFSRTGIAARGATCRQHGFPGVERAAQRQGLRQIGHQLAATMLGQREERFTA